MNGEKIFLFVVLIALVAFVCWRPKAVISDIVAPSDTPETPDADDGNIAASQSMPSLRKPLAFMSYAAPWLFVPPVGNILPSKTEPRGAMPVFVVDPIRIDELAPDCGCD